MKGNRSAGPFFGWGLGESSWERPTECGKLRPEGYRQVCPPGRLCEGRGGRRWLGESWKAGFAGIRREKWDPSRGRRARSHFPTPQHKDDPVREARSSLPALGPLSLGLMDRWWAGPATSWAFQRPGSQSRQQAAGPGGRGKPRVSGDAQRKGGGPKPNLLAQATGKPFSIRSPAVRECSFSTSSETSDRGPLEEMYFSTANSYTSLKTQHKQHFREATWFLSAPRYPQYRHFSTNVIRIKMDQN